MAKKTAAGKTKDVRMARGVYQNPATKGWRVYVYVGGKLRPKRLPAEITDPLTGELRPYTLKEAKAFRQGWEVDLKRGQAPKTQAEPGTFADDVVHVYLPAVKSMPSLSDRIRHMNLWVREFGHMPRASILPVMIQTVLERWFEEGPRLVMRAKTAERESYYEEVPGPLSASEVNNRRSALENFYTVVNAGTAAKNPVKEVEEKEQPEREPRALPWPVVDAVLEEIPDRGRGKNWALGSKTLARLRVLRWTGFAHAQLRRVQPEDLNLEAATLFRRPRRKGKAKRQRKGRVIPLLPQAVEAFRRFHELNCYGTFSRASMWKTFQRAARKARKKNPAIPPNIRPYDLRHTFATQMVLLVDDERAAQDALDHSSISTTRFYTGSAVDPRMQAAFGRMHAAMAPKPPDPTPTDTTPEADTSPIHQPAR